MMRFAAMLAFLVFATIGPAHGAEVKMAFGEKIPPFCFPETNSGIELEVIGESLAYRGHVLKPLYFSFARVPLAFKKGEVDATMTDLGEDLTPYGGFYGDPAVFYDNVFLTLKEKNFTIKKPDDLHGLTVVSFQGASKRYPDWLDAVKKAGHYYELADQELQVLTLNGGRYDVVLSDRNIFKYFTLKLKKETGFQPKPTQEHHFVKLNPLDYRPIFRDKSVRDDFNVGLKHLKETGRYQAIYDKYLKE
ncbi:substrate-binding periplasmic protein [Andreprevotia chitinilytica]|uniref:substrate-binding periplasmic protein n=1 Tax=Andreprevotia chitinilytica TaxID=396808 RepID=UPI000556668C|nr:ABC transporter substrate-binding protein [Andreprevotia chitinilytica]